MMDAMLQLSAVTTKTVPWLQNACNRMEYQNAKMCVRILFVVLMQNVLLMTTEVVVSAGQVMKEIQMTYM